MTQTEDTGSMPNANSALPQRKLAVGIARVGITGVLIFVLARSIDWSHSWTVVRNCDPVWLAAAVCIIIIARLVMTLRWAVLLRALGQRPDLTKLNEIVFASLSLGILIPGSVGMDVARGIMLSLTGDPAKKVPRAIILSSILLDRAIATIGTLTVAIVGAVVLGYDTLALVLGAALVIGCCGLVFVANGIGNSLAQRFTLVPLRIRSKIKSLFVTFQSPNIFSKGLIPSFVLSLVLTACRTFLFIFLYRAFGEQVPSQLAFTVIPILLVVMMIPATIGGFGLRELVLIKSFATVGISPEVSAAVGILSFVLQQSVSLPFAIHVIFVRRARGVAQAT